MRHWVGRNTHTFMEIQEIPDAAVSRERNISCRDDSDFNQCLQGNNININLFTPLPLLPLHSQYLVTNCVFFPRPSCLDSLLKQQNKYIRWSFSRLFIKFMGPSITPSWMYIRNYSHTLEVVRPCRHLV